MVFKNRVEAGMKLAQALSEYKDKAVVVFALPRGGVVLGAEVAKYLNAPLEIIISRKIGHPMSPEYAIGAVTETGQPVWNETERLQTRESWRESQVRLARQESKRRRIRYQGDQPAADVSGKTAIVVDDGIATGLTMIASIQQLRKQKPEQIVVAVPVAPEETGFEILKDADKVVVLHTPSHFGAIGAFYEEFEQVSDEEVRQLLRAYRQALPAEPLDLSALNSMLATVDQYPVTSGALAAQSKRLHSPANVVQFFESIPSDTEFKDKTDVIKRSEEVEVLMEEEQEQPDEYLRSYYS